jgi:hypothetical protein
LAVLLVCLLPGLVWQTHLRAASHNQMYMRYAQLDLGVISDSLKGLSADGATAIPLDSVRHLDARVLYNLLSATNAGAYFLERRKEWDRRQELVDPWGRPFHIQLVCPAGGGSGGNDLTFPAAVKIWSAGPNGRDEQGTGDDIICQTVPIRLRK